MTAQSTAHHWIPIASLQKQESAPWGKLHPRVGIGDVPLFEFTQKECDTIADYSKKGFILKDTQDLVKNPQFHAELVGTNIDTNERGMRGEFAVVKHFDPDADLDQFLADRPYRMADFGDLILQGKTTKIFDTKAKACHVAPKTLLSEDRWIASLDAKFFTDRYSYLDAFIFVANHMEKNRIYIMGWLTKEEVHSYGEVHEIGSIVPGNWSPTSYEQWTVPYRRLHPMSELDKCKFLPVTMDMARHMRTEYNRGKRNVAEGYFQTA